jgi:RNA recognition motif-containing protein
MLPTGTGKSIIQASILTEFKGPAAIVVPADHLIDNAIEKLKDVDKKLEAILDHANELKETFEQHGTVLSAKIITDRDTQRSRGFGFVEMENSTDASKAIKALNELNVTDKEDIEQLKQEREIKKEEKKSLLVDPQTGVTYDNETDLKRYNRALWNKNFGLNSEWYKENKTEEEVKFVL